MRVVIDTNVLVSAIFWTGKPKLLLNRVRAGQVVFLSSEELLAELYAVITSAKKPFQLNKGEADSIISHLREMAEIVYTESEVCVCKHDPDNRVLECALDGKADYILTGDKDLLELKSFEATKIVKIGDFPSSAPDC